VDPPAPTAVTIIAYAVPRDNPVKLADEAVLDAGVVATEFRV